MHIYMVALYTVTCTGLLGLAWHARRRHRRWCEMRAGEAFRWCSTLLQLLMQMQLHRGMANTFLNGDKSFEARMLERRAHIQTLLAQIETLPGRPVLEIAGFDRYSISSWVNDWQDLADRLGEFTPSQSMLRHTTLIATLLTWLRGMGESGLGLARTSNQQQHERSIVLFCDRLPALAETLGLARGLGAGLAASGTVTAVSRVRLAYLAGRINTLMQDTRLLSKPAADEGASGKNTQQCMQLLNGKVSALLDTLQNDIIACDRMRVSAATYFTSATAAIEAVFAYTDVLGQQLAPAMAVQQSAQPKVQDKSRTVPVRSAPVPPRFQADGRLAAQGS